MAPKTNNRGKVDRSDSIIKYYSLEFGMSKDAVTKDQKLVADAKSALVEVWQYDGLLDGETSNSDRHSISSAGNDNWEELGTYLDNLPSGKYNATFAIHSVMKAYKEITAQPQDESVIPEVEINPIEEVRSESNVTTDDDTQSQIPSVDVPAEGSENKNQNNGGITTMADTNNGYPTFEDEIKTVETEIATDPGTGTAFDKTETGAKPKTPQASAANSAAANALVTASMDTRKANTMNTTVANIVKAKPEAVKIAFDGSKAVGRLPSDEAVLAKLLETANKWGRRKDIGDIVVDGAVQKAENWVFDNVLPSSQENAAIMYDIIQKAVDKDAAIFERDFPVYFSTSKGTTKGYVLDIDAGGTKSEKLVPKSELTSMLVVDTLGFIGTKTKDGIQVQVVNATPRTTDTDGTADPKKQKAKADGDKYKNHFSHRFTKDPNKALDSIVVYVKNIANKDKAVDEKGFRSDLKVEWYSQLPTPADKKGKKRTTRLPLIVKQFPLAIVPKFEAFATEAGAGTAPAAIDLNSDAAMKQITDRVASALAVVATINNGFDGILPADLANQAKDIVNKTEAAAVEAVNSEIADAM